MAGFGFTMSGMLGMVIFMVLAFASYCLTLPSVIKIAEVDKLPVVSELIHYIVFVVFLLFLIPLVMGKLAELKFFNKSDVPMGSSGDIGTNLLSFGRKR